MIPDEKNAVYSALLENSYMTFINLVEQGYAFEVNKPITILDNKCALEWFLTKASPKSYDDNSTKAFKAARSILVDAFNWKAPENQIFIHNILKERLKEKESYSYSLDEINLVLEKTPLELINKLVFVDDKKTAMGLFEYAFRYTNKKEVWDIFKEANVQIKGNLFDLCLAKVRPKDSKDFLLKHKINPNEGVLFFSKDLKEVWNKIEGVMDKDEMEKLNVFSEGEQKEKNEKNILILKSLNDKIKVVECDALIKNIFDKYKTVSITNMDESSLLLISVKKRNVLFLNRLVKSDYDLDWFEQNKYLEAPILNLGHFWHKRDQKPMNNNWCSEIVYKTAIKGRETNFEEKIISLLEKTNQKIIKGDFVHNNNFLDTVAGLSFFAHSDSSSFAFSDKTLEKIEQLKKEIMENYLPYQIFKAYSLFSNPVLMKKLNSYSSDNNKEYETLKLFRETIGPILKFCPKDWSGHHISKLLSILTDRKGIMPKDRSGFSALIRFENKECGLVPESELDAHFKKFDFMNTINFQKLFEDISISDKTHKRYVETKLIELALNKKMEHNQPLTPTKKMVL